ncbi:sigma factor [Candidatus Merdisoma sp. JLR.KK011]|uniref:sigma factor n=1 Tax=Candidatus Merdisoma sp. JLR.KK011 TaxID=3114299 RepID=UPI002FF17938
MAGVDLAVLWLYCDNEMRLLKKISKSIFSRFNEPLAKADYDDFYSIANLTLWRAYNSYNSDMGISFEGFQYSCLQKKFKTELTRRHRQKRILNQFAISLDGIMRNDEECNLLDFLSSDFDTFEEVAKRQEGGQYQDKVQQYISRLSNEQVNILNLLIDGYKVNEICRILEISEKRYAENMQTMRSYENVKILF